MLDAIRQVADTLVEERHQRVDRTVFSGYETWFESRADDMCTIFGNASAARNPFVVIVH